MENLITCTSLSLGYEGRTVVRDLDFTVNKGDYLCIVGENGSGKSTLMNTLLSLRKPLSGEIVFSDALKRNDIGYLPQQTAIQKDFPASVREVVLSGCLNKSGLRPFYTREEKKRADEIMEKLGIERLSRRCYRELSGGQQQRVLLARALLATGTMIFLDEPVAGLDPKAMAEMYALIERLNREDDVTIVMISHDISAAVRYATHILHVAEKPLFFGTKEDYLKSDVGKHYTGVTEV